MQICLDLKLGEAALKNNASKIEIAYYEEEKKKT